MKKVMEEGTKMGVYEVNVGKHVTCRSDMQKPKAGNSDFWLVLNLLILMILH